MINKKDKNIIIISSAVCALLLFLYIKAALGSYKNASDKFKEDMAIAKLQKEAYDLEANLAVVNKTLSERIDSSALMEKIQSIARDTGLQLNSVEPVPAQGQNVYGSVSIKVATESSYNVICAFIARIEGSKDLFIRVDKFKIEPVTNQPSQQEGAGDMSGESDKESGGSPATKSRAELLISAIYLN